MATDASGQMVWSKDYDPYGNEGRVTGDGDTRELTFHHHQRIADAGLVYVGARWYSPRLRRFISPDPVGVPDAAVTGVNRFHYGLDNPLAYTDPESPLAILGGGLVLYGAWEAGWAFGEAINNILNDPSTVLQELRKAAGTASLGLVTRKLEKFIPKGFWGRVTKGIEIAPGKFDYLFGRVSSNAHNAARSNQLALEMKRLGVPDTAAGRQMLTEHLSAAAQAEGNIARTFSNQYGNFEVRESLFMGPSGKAATFESTFQVLEDGSRRLSTVIPFH
ncbi:rhs family protein [Gynuella sunshinyii YC6258]|uniref:Rhs family protein n=2 Tax=Gynuella sunshinyii TaxID=1445505 RepID=A0A0C5VF20_9GAMM|nr:rhs family protein [Gynuella sunshinyii YC6258]